MRPQDLTTAKTVAKVSVVSNTAGGKKSVARRSTGLDYSSWVAQTFQLLGGRRPVQDAETR
jgi:hypothetical protein